MALLALRAAASQRSMLFLSTSATAYFNPSKSRNYGKNNAEQSKHLTTRGQGEVSTDVKRIGERIKENTKTASYMGIILVGIGVTGVMFYAIFRELFSSNSPNNIYSRALEMVINDPRVQEALGAPIKGFGEESRRRRRQHVAHSIFQRNGVNHMRMQFYIKGIRNKGTVHLEMKENSSGKYDYRYLFVQLDYYPHSVIILEDNRSNQSQLLKEDSTSPEWKTVI